MNPGEMIIESNDSNAHMVTLANWRVWVYPHKPPQCPTPGAWALRAAPRGSHVRDGSHNHMKGEEFYCNHDWAVYPDKASADEALEDMVEALRWL